MLRVKNFTPILRERIYIILIWTYLDKLCLHLQFAMQIHTKQFFNGGIDKEFEKLEDEISAKFLEYIKLYSKLQLRFLKNHTKFHIFLYFYSYNRHKSRLLYKHNKVNKKFS